MKVTIYTDGACAGNPGPGGWGAVLIYKDIEKTASGFDPDTTNNRMELTAAIEALRLLNRPCVVDLFTDSAYLCNAFACKWVEKWKSNGWKTSSKKPVENKDLWLQLVELCRKHHVRFIKVKGHSGDLYNEMCDRLATGAIKDAGGFYNNEEE